ncbi:low-affinity Zn(2+) transporter zrt2 [Emydomyces testavorans]|uniref:Low-affinity Zn(2+) transporter zrt2 n=1 Tax=Emydomyces testavorans TaxID=2070801 RepID=A0AAF0DJQ1_9EURO|nr:low-affinity Zn(2+) transporter zrt2 [Emydomyces testavorans]
MDQLLTTLTRRSVEVRHAPSQLCQIGNGYDGNMNLRISAIFTLLVGSLLGALFPILVRQDPHSPRKRRIRVPAWVFFATKFFGSGVIVATAFVHLMAPAHMALSDPCLTGPIKSYPWVEGIMLMTVILLFFLELMVIRYARFDDGQNHGVPDDSQSEVGEIIVHGEEHKSHGPGQNHLDHSQDHPSDAASNPVDGAHTALFEDYTAQLTAVFILEFGIIFHSIFIGLTLAVAGKEFKTLYVVLPFHQTFEGLALGTRVATIPWPRSKWLTPYMLAIAFGLSTPIAVAIGLGVRNSYPPGGHTTLIVNGIFDSISAGILVYTSLVELMAHEFVFSTSMRQASIRTVLSAFGLLCLGAGLMAVLGKWV